MDGEGPRIAVNGFGRIGRLVTRVLLEGKTPVDLVAVNDLADRKTLAHLLRYDSVHGKFPRVEVTDDGLILAGDRLRVLAVPEPADLPWRDLRPDIVIEASGRFTDRAGLQGHIKAGAPRVLLTAPGRDMDLTVVRGVNDHLFDSAKHHLVSNASCTTNCLAPIVDVLDKEFGVEEGFMTTIHSATNDQRVVDAPHADLRRARGSLMSLIPTDTGAARAVGLVLPHLKGKLDGLAVRVPTSNVSLLDLTVRLHEEASAEQVLAAFDNAATGRLAGILGVERAPLVSVDYTHDARSGIIDAPSLQMQGSMCKLLAWYDNEWGYANRVAELALHMAS
jgi:glyceraldehyde 3-phosphate dehydrogenase